MKSVSFNPRAKQELSKAFRYYEEQSPGLGEEFLDEVEHALLFIRRYPEAAPQVLESVRRLVLGQFPYSIFYRPLHGGVLRILAVAHQKREEGYWNGRT
jgi:plasmid stabilization system protein ParE